MSWRVECIMPWDPNRPYSNRFRFETKKEAEEYIMRRVVNAESATPVECDDIVTHKMVNGAMENA